ncbi:hypothetical protein U1Q18_034643 [Sarracenia purpurea var. burkii]
MGDEGRRNKSIVSTSRPPLESQAAYYSRCEGQASFAHRGPSYELNGGFIEQNEEGGRDGAGFGHGKSLFGKRDEPGEIKEASTEHKGVISSRAGVNGKGREMYTETPKPSYAEAVIAGASVRGLVGAEILSPVHNPRGPLGNVRETARAPVGEAGSHLGYSYGELGGLHKGFRYEAEMRRNAQQLPIHRKPRVEDHSVSSWTICPNRCIEGGSDNYSRNVWRSSMSLFRPRGEDSPTPNLGSLNSQKKRQSGKRSTCSMASEVDSKFKGPNISGLNLPNRSRVAIGVSVIPNHAQRRGRNLDAEEGVEVNRANFEEAELISKVAETAKETGSENSNFSKEMEITPQVPNKGEEDHTDVEVVAETAKEPGSENSNFSKKWETSLLASDKEKEDQIDSGESGQAANMEISEGSQGYNQAITNMESLAVAVQSEAIKVPSEENQIGKEPLSQQLKLGKEILHEVGSQPQSLGDYQEDTISSSEEEEEGCHPCTPTPS